MLYCSGERSKIRRAHEDLRQRRAAVVESRRDLGPPSYLATLSKLFPESAVFYPSFNHLERQDGEEKERHDYRAVHEAHRHEDREQKESQPNRSAVVPLDVVPRRHVERLDV